MSSKRRADVLILIGFAAAVAGVALIFPPAALVVAGVGLAAIGLFGIEVAK